MKIDFNLIVLFHLLVIIQGFTAGILLLSSYRLKRQHLWLGALVIAMTLQVVDSFFISSGIYQAYKWLYFPPFFILGVTVRCFIFMYNPLTIKVLDLPNAVGYI